MSSRPFIPVPNTIEAELTFAVGSVFMTNRFYYNNEYPLFVPGDDLLIASNLGTWCINHYLPVLADDVAFVKARARFKSTASDVWATIPYTSYYGSWGDVAMPANVTLRIRSAKQRYDSKQRPYLCVPAPPRDTVEENEFTLDYQLAVIDALSYAYEPRSVPGSEWAWVSFEKDNEWRSEGEVFLMGILEAVPVVSPRRRRLRNTTAYPA